MQIFPWHDFGYHSKVHTGVMCKTKQLCVRLSVSCFSKICFLYCRWEAEFSSELPTKLPLHQVGSRNNILNKVCHGDGLWFPFATEKRRLRQRPHYSCSFCLTFVTHPTPASFPPFLLGPFPLSSVFFSFSLYRPWHSFQSFSHQTFPESFPGATHWAGCWKQLQTHQGAWEQVPSPLPVGAASSKAKRKCWDVVIYFT